MSRKIRKSFLAVFLVTLIAPAALFSQQIAPTEPLETIIPYADDINASGAREIVFSNLEGTPGHHFNSSTFGATVAGKNASGGETEQWQAIRFVPRHDVQATILSVALGYTSGTRLVNMGLYSNNDTTGSVGTVLPGGQASTTDIPDAGQCCQLTRVTLPGSGVILLANTPYWLVLSPDNVNAPTFKGKWQVSNSGVYAGLEVPFAWRALASLWPAAQILGTPVSSESSELVKPTVRVKEQTTDSRKNIIFTNLDRPPDPIYLAGSGNPIYGSSSFQGSEVWEALPFTPRADSHAKTVSAAIAYTSGTKLIKLGIYSDNDGVPGALLPGAEGSTADIPNGGECCDLTKVTFLGAGVALTGGMRYWLVASPDDVNAPTFSGYWQRTALAIGATQEPELLINWGNYSGDWLAAEIRGTSP